MTYRKQIGYTWNEFSLETLTEKFKEASKLSGIPIENLVLETEKEYGYYDEVDVIFVIREKR